MKNPRKTANETTSIRKKGCKKALECPFFKIKGGLEGWKTTPAVPWTVPPRPKKEKWRPVPCQLGCKKEGIGADPGNNGTVAAERPGSPWLIGRTEAGRLALPKTVARRSGLYRVGFVS